MKRIWNRETAKNRFFSSRATNRAWIKNRRLETIEQVAPDAKDKIMSGLLVQYDVIMLFLYSKNTPFLR